jgi:hypothetical protein
MSRGAKDAVDFISNFDAPPKAVVVVLSGRSRDPAIVGARRVIITRLRRSRVPRTTWFVCGVVCCRCDEPHSVKKTKASKPHEKPCGLRYVGSVKVQRCLGRDAVVPHKFIMFMDLWALSAVSTRRKIGKQGRSRRLSPGGSATAGCAWEAPV